MNLLEKPRAIELHDLQALIFSKDRPLQLDGTLRSFSRHCRDADGVTVRVLYTASTSRNRSLYRQVMREHPGVHFVEEFDFRRDTMFLLGLHEFVLFLVDDCLFVGDFSLVECTAAMRSHPDAIGVSLRLGRNTTYCYSMNNSQRVPTLKPVTEALLAFRWPGMDCDFGYPLEVSSSLYRAADLREVLADVPFRNPNTLEAELANRADRLRESHPVLLCPGQSLAFCAPVNLVQQVCGNRAGAHPALSAAALAEQFAQGWRMDVSRFDGFVPTGCHQEVELPLAKVGEPVPVVSVIVPCYKQAQFLREAVESVFAQTFTDWELIIVDDGSPDDTAATAEAIIAEYPGRAIRLLRKGNGGLPEARNAGIRMARGTYILPLDADDIIRPTMLEKTVGLLESNPGIAIAYTDLTHFGAVNRTIQAAEFDAAKIPRNNQLNYCSLYRYEVWECCGGYRSFLGGYEDWDFWVGCAAAGLRAVRIPEPLLLYRVKQESMYTAALARDGELRARIVLNHPYLYSPERVAQARSLLAGHPEPSSPGAPLVTVIVPTHNRPQWLCAALESILAQTMQDFEIIVVNDAGLDVSPWVRAIDESGRIRVLRHPRNRGLAAARNTGIKAARGKYLAYLDDDDLFYPNHLELLVDAAETSGHAVVYSDGCQATYSRRDGKEIAERSLVFSGNFEYRDLLVRNRIPVLCVLHRRSCIDKVGGFDETFATHEDWDMWVRLFHDFPYSHVLQTTCEYRVQQSGGSLTNTKRPDFYRTMKIIHARYKQWAAEHPGTREAQKNQLSELAYELYKSGRPVEPWDKIRHTLKVRLKSFKRRSRAA
jgi:glycosyltransferase involved in cell wall biosynthesis